MLAITIIFQFSLLRFLQNDNAFPRSHSLQLNLWELDFYLSYSWNLWSSEKVECAYHSQQLEKALQADAAGLGDNIPPYQMALLRVCVNFHTDLSLSPFVAVWITRLGRCWASRKGTQWLCSCSYSWDGLTEYTRISLSGSDRLKILDHPANM